MRLARLRECADSPRKQAIALHVCKKDIILWVNEWVWTFDPRLPPAKRILPFELFPKQEEYLLWRRERRSLKENGVIEKSRDMGVSWLNICDQVHCWLFEEGFTGCFGSRKEELVDRIGDAKSIFEKIRILLNNLPKWMLPAGFKPSKHDNYMKLINPANGSTITGEAGDNIGRGGRSSIYDLDEAAFVERAQKVDAALSNNTDIIYYTSSANGVGNVFYRKRMTYPKDWVFRFHWRDDPRKGEAWYATQLARFDPVIVASEVDIDYGASIEGIFIPAQWVLSAINLDLIPSGKAIAGLDVSTTGKNETVLTIRTGPVVGVPDAWRSLNTTQTTFKVIDILKSKGVSHLNFDADGLGAGVEGTAETLAFAQELPFTYTAIHGVSPPSDTYWEDEEKTSAEKFANLRAEAWGLMRERFRKTYNYVNKIATYPLDELISIPNLPILIAQLSQPLARYNTAGKILVESKQDMQKRGVESPDYADSLALTFPEPRINTWRVGESYWSN